MSRSSHVHLTFISRSSHVHLTFIPNSPRITARILTCRGFLLLQTELSQNLQQLSERARSTTEFIQRLKGMTDKVHVSIRSFGIRFKIRVDGHVMRSGAVKLRKDMALITSVLCVADSSLITERMMRTCKEHPDGL
jgi:hypothetical protein